MFLVSASTDACGIASEVLSRTSFGCSDVGTKNITLTVKDVNGNETEKTISVTVEDTTPPVVDAVSEIIVTLDDSGAGSLSLEEVLTSASTDACGIASEVLSRTSFGCSDVGTFDITFTVTDGKGNETEKTISVTVEDTTPPVVDAVSAITVTLDDSGAGSLSLADVLNSDSADACGIASEVLSRTSFGCSDVGTFDITLTVTDRKGNEAEKTISVTVEDTTPPVVDAVSEIIVTLDETGAGSLALADVLNSDSADACGIASEVLSRTSFGCSDVGTFDITLTVTDGKGNETEKTISVTVVNDSPTLSEITGPEGPVEVGTSVTLSANYVAINIASAIWYFSTNGETFGEGIPGAISDGQIKGTFTLDPEVYNVKLIITDICGSTAISEYRYIVIYDPDGGFVTGGGWFMSQINTAVEYMQNYGKANFGFNAKYKNGKNNMNEVDGNTNFQFKEGDFHFKSSSHDDMSLVISGAKATYRGVGTVNGTGTHKFMVTAIDGDLIGKTDKFRIRVWDHNSSSVIIYDNEVTASENAEATTELGGGSIVIHKPKGNGNSKTQETMTVAQAEVEDVDILSSLMAYPNPMERTAQIEFSLSASANAELHVFDLTGRRVAQLFDGKVEAGREYEVQFDRENLMPGTYVYRLTTDRGQVYTRMLVIK